jgi:hypothetical protein
MMIYIYMFPLSHPNLVSPLASRGYYFIIYLQFELGAWVNLIRDENSRDRVPLRTMADMSTKLTRPRLPLRFGT